MSEKFTVFIVTLNWNRCSETLSFLECCDHLTYAHKHIIVVDNGSTDESIIYISKYFPKVHIIANLENKGFSFGANQGIKYAVQKNADYIFIVNNDTILDANIIECMIEGMNSTEADIATPIIYYADQPEKIWSIGGDINLQTLQIMYHKDCPMKSQPFKTDFITGCGIFMRKSCINFVGLFDERFFMYYEDVDYCVRLQQAQGKAIVVPRAKMWHKVAVSSGGKNSPGERFNMAKSSVQFYKKYALPYRWIIFIPLRLLTAIKISLSLIYNRKWYSLYYYWKGIYIGLFIRAH